LNRAGVGDIYAIRTALLDWKLAAKTRGDEFNPEVAREAEEVIRQLRVSAADIRSVTNAGIERIVASHAKESSLQRPYTLWRESEGMKNVVIHGLWPAEGSEHSFFYALEKLTGRHFVHGEAVGAGSVISFYLHGDDVDTVIRDLDSFGLEFRPAQYGVSFEEFESAINSMMDVTLAMRIDYPIFRQRNLTKEEIKEIWKILS
jgi:glycerol dehydrogenase-like iron-containing ADH family enzyme